MFIRVFHSHAVRYGVGTMFALAQKKQPLRVCFYLRTTFCSIVGPAAIILRSVRSAACPAGNQTFTIRTP